MGGRGTFFNLELFQVFCFLWCFTKAIIAKLVTPQNAIILGVGFLFVEFLQNVHLDGCLQTRCLDVHPKI